MASRAIRFEHSCDAAAERVGGYELIDESLDRFWEAIARNPYGFPRVESPWGTIRYVRTIRIGECPPLFWYFSIQINGDVSFTWVELDEEP